MAVLLGEYSVVVSRHVAQKEVRHLYLEADSAEAGIFKHFALYFYETLPGILGYVNPDNGYVVPFLPIQDFKDIYHILQSEKPVYAEWAASGSHITWFQIKTFSEPLGEGLANQASHP